MPTLKERLANVSMTREEYERAMNLLGRMPNEVELGMIGSLWSEHCSYKSSRVHLRLLPTQASWVAQGPGENAGAVDIGDGWLVVFKMESHNHPSAVEPYQGAATGIGGIIRDILALGARPIALLDSLRFGPLSEPRNRYLFSGVVSGIADYGNCVGIPTVGGEIYFDSSYSRNPLVNVMCVGVVRKEKMMSSKARGVGNPLLLIGATTGRDGIHGASGLASAELGKEEEEKRPTVQVGDPFRKKTLIEAILEILEEVSVVAVQDMGAAGLTSAAAEMASKGRCGIQISLPSIPLRTHPMLPYEIMLSESQERMLLLVRKGEEKKALQIARKWGLEASVIGSVISSPVMRVVENSRIHAEIPVRLLTEDMPVYHRPMKKPRYLGQVQRFDMESIPLPVNAEETLYRLLSSPTLACKKWVYRQYDHMVQTQCIRLPGSDSAILRLKETDKAIAVTTDGNGTYCYLDPLEGGKLAVCESARNLSAVGACPLGITDCLNFGNPEDPEIMWQFREVVKGIAEAARYLNVPVVSGNVSFYNESPLGAVDPTPVIGMVGVVEDLSRSLKPGFKEAGDWICVAGPTSYDIGGSEYLKFCHGLKRGKPPRVNLEVERRVQNAIRKGIRRGLFHSVKDISEGGLAVALLEELSFGSLGAQLTALPSLKTTNPRWDFFLFSEAPSRFLITVPHSRLKFIQRFFQSSKISFSVLGQVTDKFVLSFKPWKVQVPLDSLLHHWRNALMQPYGETS